MTGRLAWVQMRNWKPWAGWETNLTVDFARPRGHVSQKGKQNRHKNRSKSKVSNNVKLLGQKVPLKKIINKNGQGEILLQKAKSYSPNSYQAKITRKSQKGQKADFNERVYQKNHFINQTFARLRKRNKKPSKKTFERVFAEFYFENTIKSFLHHVAFLQAPQKAKVQLSQIHTIPRKESNAKQHSGRGVNTGQNSILCLLALAKCPSRTRAADLEEWDPCASPSEQTMKKESIQKKQTRRTTRNRKSTACGTKAREHLPVDVVQLKAKKNTLHRHRTGAKHLAPQPMVSTSPLQAQTMKTLWPPIARRFLWCNLLRVSEVKARTVFCGDKKRSGKTCKVAG